VLDFMVDAVGIEPTTCRLRGEFCGLHSDAPDCTNVDYK